MCPLSSCWRCVSAPCRRCLLCAAAFNVQGTFYQQNQHIGKRRRLCWAEFISKVSNQIPGVVSAIPDPTYDFEISRWFTPVMELRSHVEKLQDAAEVTRAALVVQAMRDSSWRKTEREKTLWVSLTTTEAHLACHDTSSCHNLELTNILWRFHVITS